MCTAFYRDQLNSEQARVYYSIIYDSVKGNSPLDHIALPIMNNDEKSNDAFDALAAMQNDHPEIFYVSSHAHTQHIGQEFFLNLTLLYTPNQIARMRKVMDRRLRCLTAGIAHLPVWEREKILYERIRRSLSYENHQKKYDHNIVGPLMQGSGVCQGFAHLVILAMRRIGIPCIYVSGKANPEDEVGHGWNMVWINNKTYHLDVTWEYVHENNSIAYAYFNLTDPQIQSDHQIISTEGLPACTDAEYGYHCHTGTLFQTREDLSDYLKKAFQTGDGPFSVRMATPCDIKEVISSTISNLPCGYYWHTCFQAQSTALIWRESAV